MADAFEQAWFEFLVTLNSVPEILKTGVRSDAKARQWWFANKDPEIRTDPLLRYLLHARGGDFHGAERLLILRLSEGSHEYRDLPLDASTIPHGIFHIPDHVKQVSMWYELQPAHDINGNTFDPPRRHLGSKLLDSSAVGLARKALDYYAGLIREAESFVVA